MDKVQHLDSRRRPTARQEILRRGLRMDDRGRAGHGLRNGRLGRDRREQATCRWNERRNHHEGRPTYECHIDSNHGSRRGLGGEGGCQGGREIIEGEAEVVEQGVRGYVKDTEGNVVGIWHSLRNLK